MLTPGDASVHISSETCNSIVHGLVVMAGWL
jgi:hypothetical protein